jgi:DNA-directed RNA polymerase specialized sigma24 family protein
VARERGRFRAFLLTALKRYMANEWDRQHAAKRGGFAPVVPIDQTVAETRFAAEAAHQMPPDLLFDRQWALTLLERTLARLQEEYTASGRARLFEALRNSLTKEESALSHNKIAAQLGLSEAAVKMALHRLRGRYREILLQEIGETVSSPAELDEEVRQLFSAFGP